MQKQASLLVQSPMSWYALVFAYFLGLLAQYTLLPSVFCMFLLFVLLLSEKGQKKSPLLLLSLLCYILAYGYTFSMPAHKNIDFSSLSFINKEQRYSAHIDRVQSLQDKRLRLIVSQIESSDKELILKEKAVVYIPLSYLEAKEALPIVPLVGMKISFNAALRPVNFPKNFGITDASSYWHSMDVFYSAYINVLKDEVELEGKGNYLARLRNSLYNAFLSLCIENNEVSQAKAILIALIFGERFYIDTQMYTLFTKASLVHSIALSGMHLLFAVLLAFVLVKILVYFLPSLLERFPQKFLTAFFSLPLALLYFWIGNAPLSLLRASLMLLIFSVCLFMYKKFSLLDCLALAGFIILLLMPDALIHLGFQFSVLSVFAIALFAPFFSYFRSHFFYYSQDFPRKRLSFIKRMLLYALNLLFISFVIQVFLLPLQASVFGVISPNFILNVLWLPLLQLLILPLAFLSLFSLPFLSLSEVLITSSSFLVSLFLDFLQYLDIFRFIDFLQAYRPDIWQSIGYYLFILSLLYWKKLKLPYVFLTLSLLCLFTFPLYTIYDNFQAKSEERIVVRILSVGQGQSILIQHADMNFLIDAGGVYGNRFDTGRDTVAKVLSYRAFPKIDSAFITHFDLDHAKGFFHLIKYIDIEKLYYSALDNKKEMRKEMLTFAKGKGIENIALHAGHSIELVPQILYAQVLSPDLNSDFNKLNYSNNTSLVLRLVHKNKGIVLICGDIEHEGIEKLLERNTNLQAELLILPHHGAQNAYNEELYDRVSPSYVVASTALFNRFGFPTQSIIDYFSQKNIEVLNTAFDDEIVYVFDKLD